MLFRALFQSAGAVRVRVETVLAPASTITNAQMARPCRHVAQRTRAAFTRPFQPGEVQVPSRVACDEQAGRGDDTKIDSHRFAAASRGRRMPSRRR